MRRPRRSRLRARRTAWHAVGRTLVASLACAASLAAAQVSDTGSGTVVLTPRLTATLPGVVQLRLSASEILFDLGGDLLTATQACVYGPVAGDLAAGEAAPLDHQGLVYPLGTGFRAGEHPTLTVEGAGAVSTYPPLRLDASGSALPRSDEDFVCYRTYLLYRFANGADWQLTVERPVEGERGLSETIYVRASGCEPSLDLEGLFPLATGERRLLADAGASAACPDGDLVVLAVKTRGARAGEAAAHLVYTLMAPLFEASP